MSSMTWCQMMNRNQKRLHAEKADEQIHHFNKKGVAQRLFGLCNAQLFLTSFARLAMRLFHDGSRAQQT